MSSRQSEPAPQLAGPVHQLERAAPQPPSGACGGDTFLLRDGRTVTIRPIQPNDDERLRAFHRRLQPDTVIYRFFHYMPELSAEEAHWFTHLDYDQRMALVATSPESDGKGGEAIRAVGRYESLGPSRAEVAFVVQDAWQGNGIASTLLKRLARFARVRGLATFVAVTMGSNVRMLDVFRHSGFLCKMRYDGGEIAVTLDLLQEPYT
jgi:GNAT superfamily N-acetyltransferase